MMYANSLNFTPLALGTVKLGRNAGVKYPAPFNLPSDQHAADLLALAADLGITTLDTAPAYGIAEERLGKLIADRNDRDRWTLCTKVGESFDPVTAESTFDFTASGVRASIERSLERLRTDRLDLVCIHSDGDDLDIFHHSDAVAALRELKAAGKIRAIGASTKTVEGGLWSAEHLDATMITVNAAEQAERVVAERAAEFGTAILVKKALASGHKTESPVDQLRAVLKTEGVTSVVVGTISLDHLRENARAMSPA
ncbi:MAG: aldo/keto reductase [Planctomycetota bacterium]